MLVDRTPQPVLPTCDADDNLIEVLLVARCRQTPGDLIGKGLAELHHPLPNGLVADQDTPCRQHLLHHARAERKPEVKPDGTADHFSGEAVAAVARVAGRAHSFPITASCHLQVKLTVPVGLLELSSLTRPCPFSQGPINPFCLSGAPEP